MSATRGVQGRSRQYYSVSSKSCALLIFYLCTIVYLYLFNNGWIAVIVSYFKIDNMKIWILSAQLLEITRFQSYNTSSISTQGEGEIWLFITPVLKFYNNVILIHWLKNFWDKTTKRRIFDLIYKLTCNWMDYGRKSYCKATKHISNKVPIFYYSSFSFVNFQFV